MNPQPVLLPDALELREITRAAWQPMTAALHASGVPTNLLDETELKAKLTDVETRKRDLRDALAVAKRDAQDAKTKFETEGGDTGSATYKAALEKTNAVTLARGELDAADEEHIALLSMAGGKADPGGMDIKTALQDPGIRERLGRAGTSKARVGDIQLGTVIPRDKLASDVTGTTAQRRGSYYGIVPQLRRSLTILDLIPTGVMDGNSIPYTRVSGSFDTAAETPESTAKPEAAVGFTDATADAKTIAHWSKARKQTLADVGAMETFLADRLRYGVLRRLQGQILAGDGTGENLTGILTTTGIGSVAYTSGALAADQVLKGITQILGAEADPNAIVMHPVDFGGALAAKASGDGHYFSNGPFNTTPHEMWGLPLVASTAVAQGTALVGDFTIGAQLFIREGMQVLISDADGTDFTLNRVTILAEMRAAVAVFQPTAFTRVALQ